MKKIILIMCLCFLSGCWFLQAGPNGEPSPASKLVKTVGKAAAVSPWPWAKLVGLAMAGAAWLLEKKSQKKENEKQELAEGIFSANEDTMDFLLDLESKSNMKRLMADKQSNKPYSELIEKAFKIWNDKQKERFK